ncbi:undecaprenyldiphospho-muramoylpentapeptide beta-N-acetylglucosaminyltransferase [Propioniciclava coleopterorum]|uniref:UDP-N-acetylglucosamine--N-acetylmuramyl-(pentapeptide) pyrophosphoryl-undecaprenol N-acetylglucosamine transferase n=1 Tax=Propioniciclava coleopterorum TaxID=2714937 RepID=A0A6G7Y8G2_9ACTN|nr:undecaprenyldiphospho-muramoylpentapeptide beta-N-acetylglucosaminyltransferase [Propioniciclava coleopterorum]QIK72966.1 undecaprenyldiphospho-muramoylpentapeptide beta-N-acetylglucosaminyltransferase [Propioniciclava coleopterorum]
MVSIVLAGGGTAGHTSPLIATAERLREQEPDVRLTVVGTPKGIESRVIPAAGLDLWMIPPVPLPRRPTPALLRVPGRLMGAVRQSIAILDEVGADAVVGFGGYVSLPVYLAALARRVPVVIHEQNAVPGLANKIATRFASVVAVSFPDTPLKGARYVGLPLRAAISRLDADAARAQARADLGFEGERPLLLVSGGSQGAVAINDATLAARDELLAAGVDVLHVLGPRNLTGDHVVVTDPDTGASYRPVGYVDAMEQAYAAADLMVGRSGAGTVMETATVGLPVVFVPLPHGNGEQARNATFLVEGGAGVVVPNAEFDGPRLVHEVLPLLNDPERLAAVRGRLAGLVPKDAAADLAAMVLDVARGK